MRILLMNYLHLLEVSLLLFLRVNTVPCMQDADQGTCYSFLMQSLCVSVLWADLIFASHTVICFPQLVEGNLYGLEWFIWETLKILLQVSSSSICFQRFV